MAASSVPRHFAAPSMRALLLPFGIGVSTKVALARPKNAQWSLTAVENIAAGTPLVILPDGALLTSQSALDADANGLVPPPAEMLEMYPRNAARLDELYLAYYLSVRYFTHPADWYAAQLDWCRQSAASPLSEASVEAALWQRAARDYVSAPQPLFLAAASYVRCSAFRKPAATDGDGPPQPAVTAVAPVLDVLTRSAGAANVTLSACTAKDVKSKHLSEHLRGARQALQSQDDACPYWLVAAQIAIAKGESVSLSSQS